MNEIKIPLLMPADIECRVQQVKETKTGARANLLLYKNARTDMRILDEVYGANNWQRTHEVIDGNLYCNIDIWDAEKMCWVRKQDVGTESNTEKEKGQASDSFKRAGFNVGIGRELYTAPSIWIDLTDREWDMGTNGKPRMNPWITFKVKEIEYEPQRRQISKLVIEDSKGVIRFPATKKAAEKAVTYGESSSLLEARKWLSVAKWDTDKALRCIEHISGEKPDSLETATDDQLTQMVVFIINKLQEKKAER